MKNLVPVVFLDRDGVLVKEKSYIVKCSEMEIFPYSKEAVYRIHQQGYKAVVITNQSAIAKGYMKESELQKMNRLLIDKTNVDAIYFCPHWFNGKNINKPYQIPCNCRKPGTALIESAIAENNLTLKRGFFVGDRASDIQTGINCDMTTVLLESGYGTKRLEKKISWDYCYSDLLEFAENLERILNEDGYA